MEEEDEDYSLRDLFARECIKVGADPLSKLMAATYLAQFENLEGEFCKRPVFIPDFCVCRIPYSSGLLEIINHGGEE